MEASATHARDPGLPSSPSAVLRKPRDLLSSSVDGDLQHSPSQVLQHEHILANAATPSSNGHSPTPTLLGSPRVASLNGSSNGRTPSSLSRSSSTTPAIAGDDDEESEELGDGEPMANHAKETNLFFLKKRASTAGSITSNGQTIDLEDFVAEMAHPITGISIKDRKWHFKTYKQCFVGAEAVDWIVARLTAMDRDDAVSLGQELLRLQFFAPVSDDCKTFLDDNIYYVFMIRPRPDKSGNAQVIRSLEQLAAAAMDPKTGVALQDRQRHFKTYQSCFVGSDLVDWLMSNLPLRSRDEAEKLGQTLMSKEYMMAIEPKPFKDDAGLYRWLRHAEETEIVSVEKEVALNDFELLKVIGVGAFGKVLMIKRKDTGQIYAMKVLDKQEVAVSERAIRNLKSERNILRNDHPFLVHLHYSFQTDDSLYLVMDYLSGGDMFFHLRKKGRFTEKEAQFFAAEITLGLEHLHSCGIIYRDLKPENVLFDKDGHVCLTDFGISKEVGELKTKTLCGTPSYLGLSSTLYSHFKVFL
eukprot:TRINITY_DN2095_c1_g1_i2.p1 TRINITY_DN2095_c1_g1~~TRINITY_DN2095_c1_g1_i2.p1  ORF type:complete len:527 (+),score=89.72 TRINITY_DN2095_c1_g1_i2:103-1683(+)